MTTLTFDVFQKALDEIAQLGVLTDEFECLGVKVKIQNLSAEMIDDASERVLELGERAEESELYSSWFMERNRWRCAHALLQVGSVNLEGVDFIETQVDSQGAIKVPRVEAVYQMLRGVSDFFVETVHKKVLELNVVAEKNAREGVTFLEEDPLEELERLKARMHDLESELGLELTDFGSEDVFDQVLEDGEAFDHAFRTLTADEQEEVVETLRNEREELAQNAPVEEVLTDAHGTPLTGVELEYAREQERLWQQHGQDRAASSEAQEALRSVRRPLNQTPYTVQQGSLPSKAPTAVANHRPSTPLMPSLDGMEPTHLRPGSQGDGGQVQINPSTNTAPTNPLFKPRKK